MLFYQKESFWGNAVLSFAVCTIPCLGGIYFTAFLHQNSGKHFLNNGMKFYNALFCANGVCSIKSLLIALKALY